VHDPTTDIYNAIDETAKRLYVDALKTIPPDVTAALERARARETHPNGREVLDIILRNIDLAGERDMLVCQDTGTVVYWLEVGEDCPLNLARVTEAIRAGTERATIEHPLRSNSVHTITREHTGTNTGRHLPVMHYEFVPGDELRMTIVPKGSGSENQSFMKMLTPAQGLKAVKEFVLQCVVDAAANPCPPTIMGVGLGGTSDLATSLAKKAIFRPIDVPNPDPVVHELEVELFEAANTLGIGPMGLGGDNTVLAVNIEQAHTHITQNPVAVNFQCWAARRMSARVRPDGAVDVGF
jgi:tartrate/fumarate subfamily iron-sulfur-dependent hydro-lyase alpha chain